ncbi:hypothetical protein PN499_05750 [Kamptonema animale CS-326]|jgi:uncharacterized membrane protein|uniref:hypothetical protein n=1 Tax=Kamptonema animale TaxID=92934 RepID=UPI00232E00E9|nr:hypothetical protein [Kamptonema animale]MDB9510680.1 hypothetical protein [Kamptonema animale CS-326]
MMIFIFSLPFKKWLFAALALIVGLFLISEGFQVYSLACNRTEKAANTCEISHFTLSGTSVKQFPLSQLKEARVQQSSRSKITVCILVTEKEVLTFGSLSTNYAQGKQEMVSEINTFLQNPKQLSLSVKEPPGYSIILMGIICNVVGLLLFFIKTQ